MSELLDIIDRLDIKGLHFIDVWCIQYSIKKSNYNELMCSAYRTDESVTCTIPFPLGVHNNEFYELFYVERPSLYPNFLLPFFKSFHVNITNGIPNNKGILQYKTN